MTNPFASDWLGRKRPASILGPGGVSLPRRVSYHPSPVDWRDEVRVEVARHEAQCFVGRPDVPLVGVAIAKLDEPPERTSEV